jgi:hypothetical protein
MDAQYAVGFRSGSETRETRASLFFAPDTSVAGLAGFSKISDAYEKSDGLAESFAVWALFAGTKRRKGCTKTSPTRFRDYVRPQVLAGTSVALQINDLVSLRPVLPAAHWMDWS